MIKRTVAPIDKGWSFKRVDDASSDFLPVSQFPTNIHLDLLHHNLIPDPFIGKNEDDVQWVGENAWVYRTTFSASPTKDTKSMLAFDGLDTFATVVLNGKVILRTEDMFIPERVEVSNVLQVEKENVLEITFESAWFKGKEIVEKFPHHHWGCWNGDVSRLAVRKAQYHYVGREELLYPDCCSLLYVGLGLGSSSYDLRALEACPSGGLQLVYLGPLFHNRCG